TALPPVPPALVPVIAGMESPGLVSIGAVCPVGRSTGAAMSATGAVPPLELERGLAVAPPLPARWEGGSSCVTLAQAPSAEAASPASATQANSCRRRRAAGVQPGAQGPDAAMGCKRGCIGA